MEVTMNALKLALLIVGIALAALLGLWAIGLAFSLLKSLFWVIVLLLIVALLWKLFGSSESSALSGTGDDGKLQNPEMTLDEYRRKIEALARGEGDKRP
jgi:hypothetical protein